MNQIFLDTSAYSAFKRGHRKLRHQIRETSSIQISIVTLGELRAGFLGGERLTENLEELADFLSSPRVSIVQLDEATAERYAIIFRSLRAAGTPIPTNDIWIAASAMQHGSILVTTDSHFQDVPQVLADLHEV